MDIRYRPSPGVSLDRGRRPPIPERPEHGPESRPEHRPAQKPARPPILSGNADVSDLLLLAILYLLYRESRDEEFLIILVVMALSIFGVELGL